MKLSLKAQRQMLLFARIRDELRQWERHQDKKAYRRATKLLTIALNRNIAILAELGLAR